MRVTQTITGADGVKEHVVAITGDTDGAKIEPIRVKDGDSIDLSILPITSAEKESSIIIGPGVPAKTNEAGQVLVPPGVKSFKSKEVYVVMIRKLLPTGVLGLLAAALMAALMGNLSSASNSIATMVSYDIVKRFRPNTGDKELVKIGRIATLTAIASGIALVPLLDRYESIFNGLNEIIAHMAPPITCVFVLGVFWPAASARSATLTMVLGSIMGALIFALKTLHTGWPDAFSWLPAFFYKTPFMMMAFYMCAACFIMQIAFTKLMPKLAGEDAEQLFWPHPFDALKAPGWPGILNYKILATIVVLAMTTLYVVFR